jgi:GNAT superfamily N-acetyltransferase
LFDPGGRSIIGLDAPARPFDEGDVELVRRMLGRLSPHTVRRRFFTPTPELTDPLFRALTSVDHDQHEALVIELGGEIVGLASYHRSATEPEVADVAVLVEDGWQHHGLGRRLSRELSQLAATRGIRRLHADVQVDNRPGLAMIRLARQRARTGWDGDVLSFDIPLAAYP